MTNREKFKEIFGIDVKWSSALSPQILALRSIELINSGTDAAEEWLNAEYKEKTANWILKQRDKFVDICCPICGHTRVEEYAYNYTVDQLNKEDLQKLYKESGMYYCEKCGAEMLF